MTAPAPPHVLLLEDAPSLGRLFSNALLEAHLEVEWVQDFDDALHAVTARRPDLIVVDDLLDGVCAADRLPELLQAAGEGVPLVAMSCRAEQSAPRYAELGAAECLSKPLPPRSLAARCRFVLADGAPDAGAETDPFVLVFPGESEPTPTGTPHPLLAVVSGALRRALEMRLGDEEAAADMARSILEDEEVAITLPTPDLVLDADLSGVSVVQVVQMLALEQQSGLLQVHSRSGRAEFTFADGQLDLAVSPPADDRELLAAALATGGLMELGQARKRVATLDPRQPSISQVVDKGWARANDLRRAVAESSRQALFEALTWREGRITFRTRGAQSSLATDIGLSLSVDRLLMEGAHRMEGWHVIEKRLPDPEAVFIRDEERLTDTLLETLTRPERAVVDLLDGKTSIDGILDRAEIPSYDVQALLHRLITIRLIRPRAAPALVEEA